MRSAALLLLFVVSCLAQVGDAALPPLTVRALICEKVGRDVCGKRTAKFLRAPARIRVEVYLAQHPDNRALTYGLVCDGFVIAESFGQVDGHGDPPIFSREFVDIGPGECYAAAVLTRKDGATLTAKAGPLQILTRD